MLPKHVKTVHQDELCNETLLDKEQFCPKCENHNRDAAYKPENLYTL